MARKTLILLLFIVVTFPAFSQDKPFKSTPYPVPRFVSSNSDEINVRTGPGEKYPIKWVYTQKGWPVEIILEFETWRKVRDISGEEGWVHGSLLSGRRYGIITGDELAGVFSKPQEGSSLKLKLEPGVRLALSECEGGWCKAQIADTKGWVQKKFIWGVYPDENFD